MPKRAQYIIFWSVEKAAYLLDDSEYVTTSVLPEGERWQHWLQEHHSFAFQGRNGQMNMLKEKRRGEQDYWYAYQRHGERMVKQYAGRSTQLSMERLEDITATLTTKDETSSDSLVQPALSSTPALAPLQFEPLLMPKLQFPRMQKSLLLREHLLKRLDESLDYAVTVIAGPAGSGKTTTVAQWIAERATGLDRVDVAYITLVGGCLDPFTVACTPSRVRTAPQWHAVGPFHFSRDRE